MKSLLSFVLLASLGATVLAQEQDWYSLRTTFGLVETDAFFKQPRTEAEAIDAGFIKISDCSDNTPFTGNRFIPNSEHPEIVLIYDVKGYISGLQSIVGQSAWNNGYQDVTDLKMYQASKIKGEKVYLTTAYFVDPEIICTTGRRDAEFETQGTGYTLIFQNGEDTSASNLLTVPVHQSALENQTFWKEHLCMFNMGLHYLNLNYDTEESCQYMFPVQLLYHGKELHGFVWQHFGPLEGKLWEHPPSMAVAQIVQSPPNCLMEAADSVGISTMHVYFKNHLSLCEEE